MKKEEFEIRDLDLIIENDFTEQQKILVSKKVIKICKKPAKRSLSNFDYGNISTLTPIEDTFKIMNLASLPLHISEFPDYLMKARINNIKTENMTEFNDDQLLLEPSNHKDIFNVKRSHEQFNYSNENSKVYQDQLSCQSELLEISNVS